LQGVLGCLKKEDKKECTDTGAAINPSGASLASTATGISVQERDDDNDSIVVKVSRFPKL
jgi:hypothetical protein